MNCPMCNAQLKPNARFCTSCGAKIAAAPESAQGTAIPAPIQPAAAQSPQPPAPADSGFLDKDFQDEPAPAWQAPPPWELGGSEPPAPGFAQPAAPGMPPQSIPEPFTAPQRFKDPVAASGEQPNKFGLIGGIALLTAGFCMMIVSGLSGFFQMLFSIFGFMWLIVNIGGSVCFATAKSEPKQSRGVILFAAGILIPLVIVVAGWISMRGAVPMGFMGAMPGPAKTMGLKILLAYLFVGLGVVLQIASNYVIQSGVDPSTHVHTMGAKFAGAAMFIIGIFIPIGSGFSSCLALASFSVIAHLGGMPLIVVLGAITNIIAILLLIIAGLFSLTSQSDPRTAKLSFLMSLAAINLPLLPTLIGLLQAVTSMHGMPFIFFFGMLAGFVMMLGFVYGILYTLIGGMSDILGPAMD